jgi:hypothetical protein
MNIAVETSDTMPRVAENAVCTTGSTTTADHNPTPPIDAIDKARPSRIQA